MVNSEGPFDLDNVRVEVDEAHLHKIRDWQRTNPHRTGRGRRTTSAARYLIGKYDMAWFVAADRTGAPLFAIVLRHLHRMWASRHAAQPDTFPVTNLSVEKFGFDRRRKSRALRALERAGLIQIHGRANASPMVTIIEVKTEE